jgi:uncharacterized protein YjiS (DUF1127 family)
MSVETLNIFECNSCVSERKANVTLQDRLIGSLATVFQSIHAWNERRRSVHQLAQLDDRMLSDIGLSRADVQAEIEKSIWVR